MKTFRCNNCGHQLQRPTLPYRCPQCGHQAVGLFKLVGTTRQPAAPADSGAEPPAPPVQPAAPPEQPPLGLKQPAAPPVQAPPRPAKPAIPITPPPVATPPAPPKPPPQPPPQPATAATPPVQKQRPVGAVPPKASAAPTREASKPQPAQPPQPRAKPAPSRPEQFVWAYPAQAPDAARATPLRNAPAVDSAGRIFLHVQGRLVALVEEEDRPKVLWEYVTNSHVPGRIALGADGSLRFHCADGVLHCVSSAGKQVWAAAQAGEPLSCAAPIVDQAGNTWISAYDGGLVKVDPQGKLPPQRFLRCRQRFDSAGIIHSGVLYLGCEDGYLFAIGLDGPTGDSRWDHASGQGYAGWFVNSAPAMADGGVLVVAGGDGHLYGFGPDGKPAWKTKMPGQMMASPVIDRHGHVYVGVCQAERGRQPRGGLVSVDGNSRQVRWQYAAAGPVESTPVIGDDDLVYFGDNAGTIHAVDLGGRACWTAQVEAAVRSAGTLLGPQRVAFGLDNETLVVLRCSSHALATAGWPKIARTLAQSGTA